FAREAAGALGARHSLRPLIFRRQEVQAKLARTGGEIAKLCLLPRPTLVRRSPPSGEGGCGERVGVRGTLRGLRARRVPPTPPRSPALPRGAPPPSAGGGAAGGV